MKQHFIRLNILTLLTVTLLLSGCVTKEYIRGANNIDKERVVDTETAAMARLKLAIEYLRQNNISAAKQNLDRAAAINDQIDGIASSYAFYYQKVGEDLKADQAYKKALKQFPENSSIRNNYGAFLCDLKRFEQAYQQFVIAIDTDSNAQIAQTNENAALCALRAKTWSRAQHHFSSVLRYEPYRARSILGLAKANVQLSDIPAAQQALTKYSKIYAKTPESLWLNILVQYKLNNQATVKTLGRELVSQYPKSAAANDYLAKKFDE